MATGTEFSVDGHSHNVMKRMQKLRDMKMYCDVILSVSERNFPAHRAILAASSEYFDKMFSSNMKEKHAGTVVLQDIEIQALDAILRFLYTGTVMLSLDSIADLLQAAHMMQITDLQEVIVTFLLNNLEQQNCLYFRDLSAMYSLEEVKDEVKEFFLTNFEVISNQTAFCNVPEHDLESILASDDIMAKSENTVYESLIKWTKKDLTNRRNVFPGLFNLIRLQLMTPDFLCDEVRKETLVRNFPACIESVEDALDFHLRPEKHEAQQPRKGHVFDCNALVICCTTRMYIYNYRNHAWSSIPVKDQVIPSSAVASRYQTVTFCGGYPSNSQMASATVVSFNGFSWKEFSPMKTGRAGASAVYVKGELYVFGGEKRKTRRQEEDFVEDIEMFCTKKQAWIVKGQIQTQRSFAAAVVNDDVVYLLGGYVANANVQQQTCNTVEIYNTSNKTWTTGTPMPFQQACFGAALWRNAIYIVGGFTLNNGIQKNSAYMDITDGTWTTIPTAMPVNMGNTWACCAGNNIIAVGSNNNGLLVLNPNSLKYETDNETLPGITGGSLGLVVWKQRCN